MCITYFIIQVAALRVWFLLFLLHSSATFPRCHDARKLQKNLRNQRKKELKGTCGKEEGTLQRNLRKGRRNLARKKEPKEEGTKRNLRKGRRNLTKELAERKKEPCKEEGT
jgi:hypothetical protein